MARERCIEIAVEAGLGPNAVKLIVKFWENMFCRASRYYDLIFKAKCGVTQGGPPPPPSSTS